MMLTHFTLCAMMVGTSAFSAPGMAKLAAVPSRAPSCKLGLFDMFQESEEQKARKDAQFREQQEMLARRRNPAAMEAYQAEVDERRAEIMAEGAELKELQKTGDIAAWEQMRAEGKLKSSDDLEREAGDRSWGGEGLVAERLDTRLPFIDSGYVDESQPEIEMPDLMGGLKKLFGGEQKEKDEE